MRIHVFEVPYDSGYRHLRMGRGPQALSAALVPRLQQAGHTVDTYSLETQVAFPTEAAVAFDLDRQLATLVGEARAKGAFPLVLSGNCMSCVGTVAGLGAEELGVLWFDAHGDFNTPDTTATGFLDGMALAVACGEGWRTAAASIPGFRPIPASRALQVGGRDFDPEERERFERAGGMIADPVAVQSGRTDSLLAALKQRVTRVYVHLDLDVLDPSEGRANVYNVPGGLRRAHVLDVLAAVSRQFAIGGAALTAYDPEYDPQHRVLAAGIDCALALIGNAAEP